MSGFGHSVGFDKRDAKQLLDLVNEFWRQGRAAGTDEAQRGSFCRFVVSPGQQELMHRGHSRIPGHAMFAHRAPERKRVELGGNNHRPSGKQSRHGRADQPMNVKERHDAKRNIFFGESVSVRDIRRRNRQVEMPQGHALGPPRASAGVQDRAMSSAVGTRSPKLPWEHSPGERCPVRSFPPRTLGSCGRAAAAAHELRAYRRAKQNAGVGVTQKKKKLLIGVCRIQRGCSSGDGGG